MSRLKSIPIESAEGKTAQLYTAIKAQLGGVPNIFLGLGSNPEVLASYLGMGPAAASLSNSEKETIALAVSQVNSCEYCLAAHTVLGKMSGLSESEMISLRKTSSTDAKRNALVKLTHEIVSEKGHIADKTLQNFIGAGYKESQVSEVLLITVATIFTNYFNHINKTEVDFPRAEKI